MWHAPNALAQSNLQKEARQWAGKEVNKLSFESQLSLLFWFSHQPQQVKAGGIVTQQPQQLPAPNHPYTSSIINIYQGVPATTSIAIPFPAFAIRGATSPQARAFAKSNYRARWVVDVQPDSHVLFYGITHTANTTHLTPFTNPDSLWQAMHTYQQIWWLQDFTTLTQQLFKGKKVSKKNKKWIKQRAISLLANRYVARHTKLPATQGADYTRWAWQTYTRGIRLLNNPAKLPLKQLDTTYFATTLLGHDDFTIFRRHLNFYTSHAFYPRALDFNTPYNLKRLGSYGYVFVPATHLKPNQVTNLNQLAQHSQVVLVWFSPHPVPGSLSNRVTVIQAPQLNGVTEALVPQFIYGALGFRAAPLPGSNIPSGKATQPLGRLQFGPPELVYMNRQVLNRIDTLMQNAIRQQATPGSQVLAAKNGIVVYYQNFGYKTYAQKSSIQEQYLYDLASLTKVMATTQAIMFLTERGFLDIDLPIAHYLPEMWRSDKAFIPIREILAHQAGLYPYLPFWKQVLPQRNVADALTHTQQKDALQIGKNTYIAPYLQDSLLNWAIHSKRLQKLNDEQPYGYRYSDIGFIILKTLVERITNQPLDEFLDQNLYAPMGMTRTTFNPLCRFPADEVVPTQGNGKLRMGELTGFVNDPNAALIGGVSGHAGLFSTALDLAKLMQMQLQLGSYGGTTYFYPETILNFSKRQYVGNRRGLGWDKPSVGSNGPTTALASQQTFGHTGFTGTAAWADPEHQLIFIFLSNRVYPDAENFKLNQLNIRTRIQGLLYEAIDFTK